MPPVSADECRAIARPATQRGADNCTATENSDTSSMLAAPEMTISAQVNSRWWLKPISLTAGLLTRLHRRPACSAPKYSRTLLTASAQIGSAARRVRGGTYGSYLAVAVESKK